MYMKIKLHTLLNFTRLFILLVACCISFMQNVSAQALDSKGTDFWLTFPGNLSSPVASLFISGDQNTTGTVSIPGAGFTTNFTVTVGAVTTVTLPNSVFLNNSDVVGNNGIHVTAQNEVTVYGPNREQFTTDAFLGLPTDILGTEYINLGYENVDIVNATQFGIVATENGTTVTITPVITTGARLAGVPYNITLNQGQTYLLRNTGSFPSDLSGTLISSNKKIAVFGSHQCSNIPRGQFACDHIVEELPPVTSWGRNFITVPLKTRLNGDTFRFLASTDNTVVKVNGTTVATLNRGRFFETIITGRSQVTSDKPILVAQYSNSSSYDNVTSDPFMMLIPPFEQFLGNYTITTPATGFAQNFVNVVAPSAAVGSIRLDGVIIPAASFIAVGSSGFSGAQVNIALGAHTLTSPNLPFGVFVYGFDSFDSYGYPGGQSLSPIATVNTLTLTPETGTANTGTNTCFQATLKDQFNQPVVGVRVDFNITGANPGSSGFANTNASGVAQFCYTGNVAGQDNITASVGTLNDMSTFVWTVKTNDCSNFSASAQIVQQPNNGSNGAVTLTATGGTGPYMYTLDGTSNTTGVFTGLSAGTHNFSVKDAKECVVTGSVTLQQQDQQPPTASCPKDTTIIAPMGNCATTVWWKAPTRMYPDSVKIRMGSNKLSNSMLRYKGTYNGHGYYESNDFYLWTESRDLSMGLGGHLVTITSPEENTFIYNNLRQPLDSWGAWIGLYNTGTPGSFAWVTGEPFSYSNWNRNEPNNQNGSATFIAEPYVHILGYDFFNRWNDIHNRYQQFIAEFDTPVLTYRQISGPDNGSTLLPGIYTICYETTNSMTQQRDTCCFNVTVVCNSTTFVCPPDTTITTNSPDCMAKVAWTAPGPGFPDTISIPNGLNATNSKLWLKGMYNGHAYYQSDATYQWENSKTIAMGAGGHLVTINDMAENSFIFANLRQTDWGSWIGLRNTGTPGSFAWVTGEPLTFTNWNRNEPNNQGGSATVITEPFVHILGYDRLNRWNDMPAFYMKFIAEFESPLITYKQISGPDNGSMQGPGVYTICYERTNTGSGKKDTCCFNVTVVCENNGNMETRNNRRSDPTPEIVGAKNFNVTAFPNPSTSQFSMRVESNNTTEKLNMRVMDIYGKVVEMKNGIAPNTTIRFGSSYLPGVYFTEIMQGKKKLTLKLIKQ